MDFGIEGGEVEVVGEVGRGKIWVSIGRVGEMMWVVVFGFLTSQRKN